MATSAASVNSALQQARATVWQGVPARPEPPDRRVRDVAAAFASALERGDADALVGLLAADVSWSMPPLAAWYRGADSVAAFARAVPMGSCGRWRHRLTTANGLSAVAFHLHSGSGRCAGWSITELDVRDARIVGSRPYSARRTSRCSASRPGVAIFGAPTDEEWRRSCPNSLPRS